MRELIPDYINKLVPYVPGKPVEELERELGISNSIKLASNENPLGPSPKAVEAIIKALANANYYPDSNGFYLKNALIKKHDLHFDNIVLGNGSNEVLEIIARTFLLPDDEVIYSQYSFIVYHLVTQAMGRKCTVVPARNYGHDLAAMADAVTEKTKIIFIANPNNPTGTMNTKAELDAFLKTIPDDVIVVLDEAYVDFVDCGDYPDGIEYFKKDKRVISVRTFSKSYGLAGLRVGYAVADKIKAGYMNRVREPFNVNSLALAGALAALEDDQFLKKTVEVTKAGKKYLEEGLNQLGIEFIKSYGNFILVNFKVDGEKVYEKLLRDGIIVRPMRGYGLPTWLRITVARMEENERIIESIKKFWPFGA